MTFSSSRLPVYPSLTIAAVPQRPAADAAALQDVAGGAAGDRLADDERRLGDEALLDQPQERLLQVLARHDLHPIEGVDDRLQAQADEDGLDAGHLGRRQR